MATKVYCDLCSEFISEYGKPYNNPKGALNQPFVISSGFTGKSLLEENIGWSNNQDEIKFWACKKCNEKFMAEIRLVAQKLGLDI